MNHCKQCLASVEMLTSGPAFHFDARFPGRGIVCTPEGSPPLVVLSEFQRGVEAMRRAAVQACRDEASRLRGMRERLVDDGARSALAFAASSLDERAGVTEKLVVLP